MANDKYKVKAGNVVTRNLILRLQLKLGNNMLAVMFCDYRGLSEPDLEDGKISNIVRVWNLTCEP